MKDIKFLGVALCLLVLITACGNNTERKLLGTWYTEYRAYKFNSDGSFSRKWDWGLNAGEDDGEGTWELVEDKYLLLQFDSLNTPITIEIKAFSDEHLIGLADNIEWSFYRTKN